MREYILNVFDLSSLSFMTDVGQDRVNEAHAYAQNLYNKLGAQSGNLGKDRLLAILLLGITDELLQQKKNNALNQKTLFDLLKKIDETVSFSEYSKNFEEQGEKS